MKVEPASSEKWPIRLRPMQHNIRMHLTGYSGLRPLPPAGDAGRSASSYRPKETCQEWMTYCMMRAHGSGLRSHGAPSVCGRTG